MKKSELITAVAEEAGLTRVAAAKAVDSVLARITDALRRGEDVRLPGFGVFTAERQPQREGNSASQTKRLTSMTRSPIFRAGKVLRSAIDSDDPDEDDDDGYGGPRIKG